MRSLYFSASAGRKLFAFLMLGWFALGWVVSAAVADAHQQQSLTPTGKATDQSHLPDTSHVSSNDAVITIKGLCDNPPSDKATNLGCETVITRAEFEKIIRAVQPDMKVRAQREFAERYATALVMAKKAERMGLSKSENFEEQMKVARSVMKRRRNALRELAK